MAESLMAMMFEEITQKPNEYEYSYKLNQVLKTPEEMSQLQNFLSDDVISKIPKDGDITLTALFDLIKEHEI